MGGKEQLTATATYKDMTTTDVTSQAIWAASNANATVSLKGMVTGVNRSIDTIYATFGGQTASVTISIE